MMVVRLRHFSALLIIFCLSSIVAQASWLDSGNVIKKFYVDFLGREPKQEEVDKKHNKLINREKDLLQILNEFATSKEFNDRLNGSKDKPGMDDLEFSYFELLGRPADPEGYDKYRKAIDDGSKTIEQIRKEMRDSTEGREFRIRHGYMQCLYRDADEVGLEVYLSYVPANNPIETNWKRPEKFPTYGNVLPDLAKNLSDSYEHTRRFNKEFYLQNRNLIASFFETILGRKADQGGLNHYVRKWAVGEMDLSQIFNTMRDSEEFKKRKLDDVETAFIDCLLRTASAGGLKYYRDKQKSGMSIADIRFDLKASDAGKKAAVRRLYWRILHREADEVGLKIYSDRLIRIKPMGNNQMTRNNYEQSLDNEVRKIATDLLNSGEAKHAADKLPRWREIRDDSEAAYGDFASMQLSFDGDIKEQDKLAAADADKMVKDLEKVVPEEFSKLLYDLESTLKGKDLDAMKKIIDDGAKMVAALGPLPTAELQKIFVEMLGQPAPEFYKVFNTKTSWQGAKDIRPDLKATTTNKSTNVPNLPNQWQDPKIEVQLAKALSDAKDPAAFKEQLIKLITSSKQFKDLEPKRIQAIESTFVSTLQRLPKKQELKEWLTKFNNGKVMLADLKTALEKTPEFKLIQEILATGKIIPFKPAEKTKTQNESKTADGKIQNNTVKMSDLDGFKDFEFAREVTITEAVKTEDEDGYCITGKAQAPSQKLPKGNIFLKKHPSTEGDSIYIVGFFTPENYQAKNLYSSASGELADLLSMLQFKDGAMIFTSGDVALQLNSLPDDVQTQFANVLKNSGHKSFRLAEGRNIIGNLVLGTGGAGKHLQKLLPDTEKSLLLQGRLAKEAGDIFIRGYLPAFRPSFFPKDCKQVEPTIELTGDPLVAINMSMEVAMPVNQPMTANLRFEVPIGPTGTIQLSLALNGQWKDPFGKIKGLTIGNLVVSGQITVPEMSPSFGLAGDFQLGSKIVRVAATIPVSVNMSSVGLLGSLNEIGTQDLLMLFQKMGGKAEKMPIPSDLMGLKDVQVSCSAQGDSALGIPEGMAAKGQLYIKSDLIAEIDSLISVESGVSLKGYGKEIKLGPLALTGAGPDKKAGTSDDGAVVDIQFPMNANSHAFISGIYKVFGIERGLDVLLDTRGMGFAFTDKIFNSWQSRVEVKGGFDASKPDFQAKVEIKSDLAKDLIDATNKLTNGKIPGCVKKAFRKMLTLRRAGFDGSLAETINGKVPSFWLEFAAYGKKFTANVDLDLSDKRKAINSMAQKTSEKTLERAREWAAEYYRKAAEAYAKRFAKKMERLNFLRKKGKEAKGGTPGPDTSPYANYYLKP